jgi:hypothetical protein
MMNFRKMILSATLLLFSTTGIGQVMVTLQFFGRDSVGQNLIPLDSLIVENLTETCDTLLSGPYPVLTLPANWPVGMNGSGAAASASFILDQNHPNPFPGTTAVNLYRNYPGPVNLILYDGSGAKLAEFKGYHEQGHHAFSVSSSRNGLLFLTASDQKNTQAIKMMASAKEQPESAIRYLGSVKAAATNSLKHNAGGSFIFYLGNHLSYTAHAGGYREKTISDHPVSDSTYFFDMAMLLLPVVATSAVTDITQTTATSGGVVTDDGGAAVTTRGVCWSMSPNPTTAGSHSIDGSGTGVFVSSLTGLTPNTPYYVRAYATNIVGTAYGSEETFTTLPSTGCGSPLTINHLASGGVAPVNKTVIYGTTDNIPGETAKCWITSNLGADHQATAVDDATEASAGWYWQFNRTQGYKHDGTTRTPNSTWITSISEDFDWQPSNDPCALELGGGWRIPTVTEWTNVDAAGGWTDWNGPWNSALKLHASGSLGAFTGTLSYRGSIGYQWSGSQYYADSGWSLTFNDLYSGTGHNGKTDGFSLRCVKE